MMLSRDAGRPFASLRVTIFLGNVKAAGEPIYRQLSLAPAGTYPSRQRCCAVLTRSANAAARLLLRSQAERKAASASHSGEMKGEGAPLHFQMSHQV